MTRKWHSVRPVCQRGRENGHFREKHCRVDAQNAHRAHSVSTRQIKLASARVYHCASAANKQKCQPGTPTLWFESSFFERVVIPSHLLPSTNYPYLFLRERPSNSAGNEIRSRAFPFWMALPSQQYFSTIHLFGMVRAIESFLILILL